MKLTRTDVLTMILLCIVFFGIATWNLGEINYPTSNWQATTPESFYVDLGSAQQLQTVYFWLKSGNASVDVYWGSPGHWTYLRAFSLQDRATDYSVQPDLPMNVLTRYVEFNVTPVNYDSRPQLYWSVPNPTDKQPSPFIEVSEIGVADLSNHQIPIVAITGENNTDATLDRLVDEQSSLQVPPDYMSKMYFDEVYFARSAENYVVQHTIPVERTHPDLGKLIQAVGVAVIGTTPFGWRIMGVVFGALIVALMYLIGKKLFGTWIGGFSAAFLMTFDFMHFTMTRIGTADTYLIFFTLLSQFFFLVYFMKALKEGWKTSVLPLLLAVVFFALGFSTKFGFPLFSALGLLALLAAVRLRDLWKRKGSLADRFIAFFDHPFLLLVASIGLVALIYFAIYIPDMLLGDSFPKIINLQFAMFSFHSSTVVDSVSSPWWSWPLMFNIGSPVHRWFDITAFPPNYKIISTINALGNPVVWWLGFALMLVLTERAIHGRELAANLWTRIANSPLKKGVTITARRCDTAAVFIVVVFFFSWLPYVFVGRSTYIYHFYSSVPLLCLATAYFINKYWHKHFGQVAALAIFAAVVAMFVLFYPVISGSPINTSYIHKYLDWFPSRFYAP